MCCVLCVVCSECVVVGWTTTFGILRQQEESSSICPGSIVAGVPGFPLFVAVTVYTTMAGASLVGVPDMPQVIPLKVSPVLAVRLGVIAHAFKPPPS